MLIRILCLIVLSLLAQPRSAQAGSGLPHGFVYLRDAEPTIVQDIRYAGSHNFVGRPIKGYLAAECIVSVAAARALGAAQKMLAEKRLSLIVWDCYRPKRAAEDFAQWSRDRAHFEMKSEFYPRANKTDLFALGYLATPSAHSRGSTVDVGLVPSPFSPPPAQQPPFKACTSAKGERFEDGAIDFGTGYDCLDVLGHTHAPVSHMAQQNRQILKSTMQAAGFRSYYREWWHFELVHEPFGRGFDFEITAARN